MNGIADRRGNYLRINTLYHENISYLADKLHSAFANVVKPSEERRYISCSRIGGEYSLSRREDQRYVGLDTLCGKALAGFQTLRAHRQLYNYVRVYLCQRKSFFDHFVRLKRDNLSGDRSVDDSRNLLYNTLENAVLLCDKGGVRGNPADNAEVVCLAYLVNVCGVYKQLHNIVPFGFVNSFYKSILQPEAIQFYSDIAVVWSIIAVICPLFEFRRRTSLYRLKYAIKCGNAGEARFHCRVGYGHVRFFEQQCRLADTSAVEVVGQRCAAEFAEQSRKVEFTVPRRVCKLVEGNIVHIVFVNVIQREPKFG